jgi:hypothetical protein
MVFSLILVVPAVIGVPAPRRAWAQAVLENPQPGSSQSGIGVISGWVCQAGRVDIEIDGVVLQAAYGTSREDTRGACGDANNGFGLLFNWNLLDTGSHTVRALADGVEFARAGVTVADFGTEFLSGVSGEFVLSNFPQPGGQAALLWQESQQNFVIRGPEQAGGGNSGGGRRLLENPQPGSFQSGIGVVSGWACEASEITVEIGGVVLQAAYGTSREDTRRVCGDANNGFGLLFNWNLLGNGVHTVRALADGQEFASATVTVTTFGVEFLTDAARSERLLNFPAGGTDVIIAWQQSLQNFVIARVDPIGPQLSAMDAAGDSITKAFNAQSAPVCPNDDQEFLNWVTSDTHGADLCGAGSEGVFSQAERLECRRGADLVIAAPNSAKSGAQMLDDFVAQASRVAAFLRAQPSPRYVTVWLGHNDVCAGTIDKVNAHCPRGGDQDPNNHCRTTPAAFEREFRKGLDLLVPVPEVKVGVASLVRVSQLCSHQEKESCLFGGSSPTCDELWQTAAIGGPVFGLEHGICGSLTRDCSDQRIIDAYETAKAYRDILARVTAEYAQIPVGGTSRVVTIGGQAVGGATKAIGVRLDFSDAPWVYKFKGEELSCCDCFHPSVAGQNTAARVLFDGFVCSAADVCCADTGDARADGVCAATDTSGRFVPGLF